MRKRDKHIHNNLINDPKISINTYDRAKARDIH